MQKERDTMQPTSKVRRIPYINREWIERLAELNNDKAILNRLDALPHIIMTYAEWLPNRRFPANITTFIKCYDVCSNCGEETFFGREKLFCPNCGAFMNWSEELSMSWRNEPATKKQLALIMEMNEFSDFPLPAFTGKTKGEAADWIDANMKKAHERFDAYERDGGGD